VREELERDAEALRARREELLSELAKQEAVSHPLNP